MVTCVRLVKQQDNLPMNRVMLTSTSSSDQKQRPSYRIPPLSWHGQRKDDFPSLHHPYCPALWGQWGTEQQGSVINNLSLLLWPWADSTMRHPSCLSIMTSLETIIIVHLQPLSPPSKSTGTIVNVDLSMEEHLLWTSSIAFARFNRHQEGDKRNIMICGHVIKPICLFQRTCLTSLMQEQAGHWEEELDDAIMTSYSSGGKEVENVYRSSLIYGLIKPTLRDQLCQRNSFRPISSMWLSTGNRLEFHLQRDW